MMPWLKKSIPIVLRTLGFARGSINRFNNRAVFVRAHSVAHGFVPGVNVLQAGRRTRERHWQGWLFECRFAHPKATGQAFLIRNKHQHRPKSIKSCVLPLLNAAFVLGVTSFLGGCAIHYSDKSRGSEHLFGFGQLRLDVRDLGSNLVHVTRGSRIPGLCLGLGPGHFEVSFGYAIRQDWIVAGADRLTGIQNPQARPALLFALDSNGAWGLGHLRMNSLPARKTVHASASGTAIAGLRAIVGANDTSLNVGLDARQRLVVHAENFRLNIDQNAPRWPGFDLFAARVESLAFAQTKQPKELP